MLPLLAYYTGLEQQKDKQTKDVISTQSSMRKPLFLKCEQPSPRLTNVTTGLQLSSLAEFNSEICINQDNFSDEVNALKKLVDHPLLPTCKFFRSS